MKGNNLIHNWIILFVIVLSMCSLCVSYAATVDAGTDLNKSNAINFIFAEENKDDFRIELIPNVDKAQYLSEDFRRKDNGYPLEAYIDYNYKTMDISGVEAFNLDDFQNGRVNLAIDYRMTQEKEKDQIQSTSAGIYELGNIPFFYTMEDPYWRLVNKNGSWGIGIPEIGIPDEIYKLVPDNLTGLNGYNMVTSFHKGAVKGTIAIGKFLSCTGQVTEIKLSSLGLPEELNKEICADGEKESSTLEIMANYYFSVPFGLNKETSEEILKPTRAVSYDLLTKHPQIQGKITVRINVKVIHDIEQE